MRMRSLVIVGFVGLAYTALVWGLLAGGCCKNPQGPECPPDTCEPVDSVDTAGSPPTVDTLDFPDECPPPPNRDTLDCPDHPWWYYAVDVVSSDLLNNPVYSPIDDCVYYQDTGADSAYFEWFKENPADAWYTPVVQPGIYRLQLNDDSPAELVGPWGTSPTISPDGSLLYFVIGHWGGPIMKVRLPDGEPELVRNGSFIRAHWYSPDTLVVSTGYKYFLDLKTDSLHRILINGSLSDVSSDRRILSSGGGCYGGGCFGIYDSAGIWYFGPFMDGISEGSWSPDGKEIVYGSGSHQLRVTDFARNQRILATGGGPAHLCLGVIMNPAFASGGRYIIYIQYTTPIDYDPCRHYENLVRDGQIWIMSAEDGSGKRQVSTWWRIRP